MSQKVPVKIRATVGRYVPVLGMGDISKAHGNTSSVIQFPAFMLLYEMSRIAFAAESNQQHDQPLSSRLFVANRNATVLRRRGKTRFFDLAPPFFP